jgi:predicted nucleic acid-binding protein
VTTDDLAEEDGLLLLPNGGQELDADVVRELRLADQRWTCAGRHKRGTALAQRENPFHLAAKARLLTCRRGMSGYAAMELLSVLTRLPAPQRLSPVAAFRLQEANFPESRFLSATDTKNLLREFAETGLAGGGVYDGLVAAAARKHELPLITCDRRAEPTYRVLGVNYELLEPISR